MTKWKFESSQAVEADVKHWQEEEENNEVKGIIWLYCMGARRYYFYLWVLERYPTHSSYMVIFNDDINTFNNKIIVINQKYF